jgi:hypothetical protein
MSEISRFFGISIKMFFGDHSPPHFHAEYGEFKAQINIKSNVLMRESCHHGLWEWLLSGRHNIRMNCSNYGRWQPKTNLCTVLIHFNKH